MKKLIMIGGPMGVGKSAVCWQLNRRLAQSVFLDGDWCWFSDPFVVTDNTKRMVLDNIGHVLQNFINSNAFRHIVFGWVMDERGIIDAILDRLDTSGCEVIRVSLIADEAALTARIEADVRAHAREADTIERSLARLPKYQELDTVKIDTSALSVEEVASEIIHIIENKACESHDV